MFGIIRPVPSAVADCAQSHASYGRCGLGSEGTDRLVALVRAEAAAARAACAEPPLYGAKITGGGSGGAAYTYAVLRMTLQVWR